MPTDTGPSIPDDVELKTPVKKARLPIISIGACQRPAPRRLSGGYGSRDAAGKHSAPALVDGRCGDLGQSRDAAQSNRRLRRPVTHRAPRDAGGFAVALLPRLACIPFCGPDVISNFLNFEALIRRTKWERGAQKNQKAGAA
jgi:hypothetical protein